MTTLLVGRGLLGGHVEAQLLASGDDVHTVVVPWMDHDAALRALLHAAEGAARLDDGWQLAWCAGAGVVATPAEDLAAEVRIFRAFVTRLPTPPRSMFLASSAGALYAGSPDVAPFDENSAVAALSPYGDAKLEMEEVARQLTRRGTRLLVGQDLQPLRTRPGPEQAPGPDLAALPGPRDPAHAERVRLTRHAA